MLGSLYEALPKGFPRWLYHFILLTPISEQSNYSLSPSVCDVFSLCDFSHFVHVVFFFKVTQKINQIFRGKIFLPASLDS